MKLPPDLVSVLLQALAAAGDSSEILQAIPVPGGCINHAVRLDTKHNAFLLKWNQKTISGMFTQEAEGLRLLAETNTVRVPKVISMVEDYQANSTAFILLEFIHPPGQSPHEWDAEEMGTQLAALHRETALTSHLFGLAQDNFLGSAVQPNGWYDDWIAFFRDKRLLHQMQMAKKNRKLPVMRQHLLDRLIDQLPQLIGHAPHSPSLLHGDLWSGNVIPNENRQAVLIDPAVYYGDREAEIAYTELFGGFSRKFYQAYLESWPLDKGYKDRRDLYNVYHLMNHLNLFGEAYGSQLDAILRYYVG